MHVLRLKVKLEAWLILGVMALMKKRNNIEMQHRRRYHNIVNPSDFPRASSIADTGISRDPLTSSNSKLSVFPNAFFAVS